MLIFEDISWRNFLSTGNAPTKIQLNGPKTNLVIGKNGSGKCLDRATLTAVSFADKETEKKFKKFVKQTNAKQV